ncbi:thiol:disulfide interchange protein DsbG [Trinickia terrae]|uniref:Thiol:disulfide interchange protein n=1 Tax=Trinickia terrae TaxID=2571161 RepID=A0A4U1IEU2_9BURK|nr:thiol:disulfide interchange protein DsbG [Trinickia terrae]TKC92224.1 thiol:disulfide interchange protein DsbG [Trinickia terrae]
MNRTAAALFGIVLLSTSVACAGDNGSPPVIKALESRGVTGLHEFKVSDELRGFAGVAGSSPIAVYVTRDGNAILGTRVDRNGTPLDIHTVEDLVAAPMGDATWKQLESAKWIRDGRQDAPRTVYVISDPDCPYCHRFWEASRPWVRSGKVQLRELLVGIIRADSEGKAAAILSSKDPSAALERNERDFDKGGIPPASTVSDDAKHTLETNLQLMPALGLQGTPGLIYKSVDGKVKLLDGLPQGEQLQAVMGP